MKYQEQKLIFSRNLNSFIERSGKTQKEIADDLNINPQTLNSWCTGNALPRMPRIQLLADYFGVAKSALIDDVSSQLSIKEEKDVAKTMARLKNQLRNQQGLMFDGEPMDEETIQLLLEELERQERIVKLANRKYTPKKYKKD